MKYRNNLIKNTFVFCIATLVLFFAAGSFSFYGQTLAQSGKVGNIKWNISKGTLTISGNGKMQYVEDKKEWRAYKKSIRTVVIEHGVTSIGSSAFLGFKKMTSITIPHSVTSIGRNAFIKCEKLSYVTIPNSVKTIGEYAFSRCESLTTIVIPNSVETIGEYAFSECESLTTIVIPNSVETIEKAAFNKCERLSSVTIPNSVKTIREHAFNGCESLTTIVIPNSVIIIEKYAFYGCKGLTSVTMPNSLEIVGVDVFYLCDNLKSLTLENEVHNVNLANASDMLSDWVKRGAGRQSGTVGNLQWSISNDVLTIGGNGEMPGIRPATEWRAYSNSIKTVVIEHGVTSISNYSFSSFKNMTSIAIPNSVTTIGEYAFLNCKALTSVTIPHSVKTVGDRVFEGCDNLKSLTLGIEFLNVNHKYAFASEMLSLWVERGGGGPGGSVGNLQWSLSSQNGILTISGNGEIPRMGAGWKAHSNSIRTVVIEHGVTSIGDYAFSRLEDMTSITIPNSVTSIGEYAFWECKKLSSVTIPNSVTSIGRNAFYNCTALTSVTIPNSITSIGHSTFYGCKALTSVTIPNSVKMVSVIAFGGCGNLTSLTLGDEVYTVEPFSANRKIEDWVERNGGYVQKVASAQSDTPDTSSANEPSGTSNTASARAPSGTSSSGGFWNTLGALAVVAIDVGMPILEAHLANQAATKASSGSSSSGSSSSSSSSGSGSKNYCLVLQESYTKQKKLREDAVEFLGSLEAARDNRGEFNTSTIIHCKDNIRKIDNEMRRIKEQARKAGCSVN